jgi:hypothetical protein
MDKLLSQKPPTKFKSLFNLTFEDKHLEITYKEQEIKENNVFNQKLSTFNLVILLIIGILSLRYIYF